MTSNGAPNDLLGNFNPLYVTTEPDAVNPPRAMELIYNRTIIVVTPILTFGLYPLLAKYHIKFGPIRRMTFGFMLAAISGLFGALVQWKVYATNPCGYYASTCDDVSPISIWWQVPNVSLGAISELFCNVTAYEMAYARSPPHLKAVVMAICASPCTLLSSRVTYTGLIFADGYMQSSLPMHSVQRLARS